MGREKRKQQRRKADIMLGCLFLACILLFLVVNVFVKDKAVSEEENRSLTQKPKLTAESVLNGSYMKQFESWQSDQFAGRNLWRKMNVSLKQFGGSRLENGVFHGKKGQLMEELVVPDAKLLKENIKAVNEFVKSRSEIRTSFLLVPDASEILQDALPAFAEKKDQAKMFENVKTQLAEEIHWIDGAAPLNKIKDKKIYYQTDHHWTSLGAYKTFLAAAETLEIDTKAAGGYDKYPVTTKFNGVLASTSGFEQKEMEEIEIYIPKENNVDVIVNYVEEQKRRTSLYDSSKLKTKDKYGVFLGGNASLIDIKTTAASDKTLLLLKDSFANSFVPFLAPYYKEIVMVDPRYYAGTMSEILETYPITDALFLYSGNTFFQDNNLQGFLREE